MGRIVKLVAALLLAGIGAAQAACVVPKPARNFLKGHANWSVVAPEDLGSADRVHWRKAHKGLCPGIAIADLGGGQKSYALAVTNKGRDGRMERLVLLQAEGKKLLPKTLVPAFQVGDPLVVWRAKPRTVREYGSRRRIAMAHDTIVFEKIGISAKVFHLEDGKIRAVLVAE